MLYHDISQRRACSLVGVDPKTVRRERPSDCAEIRKEMKEIAGMRRRFGYRRIGVLLAQQHRQTAQLTGLSSACTRKRRSDGPETRNAITIKLDHPIGALSGSII